ncbi:hypothetical protein AC579_1573 [Pseudocercospora musae]|uniref:GPI transamidase component PIG-S n=1 Tax=Pseudocercospora musae TaxID=113226 RepID=A0A139I1Z7_9PEZI|nr:hypothetical protein AC579_1573 [Pseudocercospora musae]KXT08710.1 hypothetical protein AC579_1573 [Pseudocercospora musae]KXT08712.1 hypothetical protein AC579_1573 [Pseudocercospora musae]KXT08713.1 hypothetical protein AC579_1573 [Pseudocercospora musae]
MEAEPEKTKTAFAQLTSEPSSSIWTRRIIIMAFWSVVVVLGIPLWTWTTSIHRSSLPLEAMNAWAEGKACTPHYPLQIQLRAPPLNSQESAILAGHTENMLNAQQISPLHSFHVTVDNMKLSNKHNALTVVVKSESSKPSIKLESWQPVLEFNLPRRSLEDLGSVAGFLSQELARLFTNEIASLSYLIKDTPFAANIAPLQLSREQQHESEKKTTRAFKYASTYHLTFSLFTPAASPSAWEIDEAINEYITPLIEQLLPISNFTIDTQVQLYAAFSPSIAGPVFDASRNHWTLQYSDLTGFVNAAEWPLSPSIGFGPTINLVLYVPSLEKCPLLIAESEGTSWIIPQWGGVQIHNPAGKKGNTLTLDDLRPHMLTFADQIAALLGVPSSPPSLPLKINSLTRERATSLIMSASSTLGALSRLTLKLTSIAIPDSVANSVDETLHRLDQACSDLRSGHFQSALENARTAEEEVEKAFFEPSMVGQVYFPDEHKVAVYVPLLGPMAVPLIMSGLKELQKFRQRKQKTK